MKLSQFGFIFFAILFFSCNAENVNDKVENVVTTKVETLDKIYLEKISDENPNYGIADSLLAIPVEISSEFILASFQQKESLEKLADNIYSFTDSADEHGTLQIAFKRSRDNYYAAIRLFSFSNTAFQIDSATYIDLDGRGEKELLLKWKTSMMGQAGGCWDGGILILDINEVPKLIFNVHNYCADEILSSLDGSYPPAFNESERKVSIANQKIIISDYNYQLTDSLPCCNTITKIPSGTLTYKNGKIVKL